MSNIAQSTGLMRIRLALSRADLGFLLASLALQLFIGLLFGHVYDIRISMATGYLVATGQDPYIPQDLSQIFNNPAFQGMTSIGYPPPWPLILGVLYLLSFAPTHNLLIYNLAIKLPIIAANVCLAYLVRDICKAQGLNHNIARNAWFFMLFNPFILYFTTAWGQFDSLVALLALFSLGLVVNGRITASAVLLALAIAFKPTPVAIVLAVAAYLWAAPWRRTIRYLVVITLALAAFCILPFILFHWDATPIFRGWNAQFSVSGGMSLTTLYELLSDTYQLPGYWWLLGFVWFPAVLVSALFIRRGELGLVTLIKNSLVLTLVFFLSRTWLSEQNLTLILPMVLLLVVFGELPHWSLTAVWVLPLIFTVFNTSPPQLLFPILPDLMNRLLLWADTFRASRLVARMLLVIPWQVLGWWMVVRLPGKREAVTP